MRAKQAARMDFCDLKCIQKIIDIRIRTKLCTCRNTELCHNRLKSSSHIVVIVIQTNPEIATAKVFFILNDKLKSDINDSVHAICKHYNVPCIDLKDIDKQSGHPSVKGMQQMADQVVKAVRK